LLEEKKRETPAGEGKKRTWTGKKGAGRLPRGGVNSDTSARGATRSMNSKKEEGRARSQNKGRYA